MDHFDSRNDAPRQSLADAGSTNAPESCPACHSASITSTAKSPNINSYWRCDSCGEVWNISRRQNERRGGYAWR